MTMNELLTLLVERGASRLSLSVGAAARLRVDGALEPVGEPLTRERARDLAYSLLTDTQKEQFEQKGLLCCSFGIRGLGRFELTVFSQRTLVSAIVKRSPLERPQPPAWLAETLPWLADGPGLVMVAGPVGSGRSTTLGWWVDHLNRTRASHIVCVSEALTGVESHELAVVEQIELGTDMAAPEALRLAARAGADVVSLDLAADELSSAANAFSSGALVLVSLRAGTLETAGATLAAALPRAWWDSVRGVVWRHGPRHGDVLDRARLAALLELGAQASLRRPTISP